MATSVSSETSSRPSSKQRLPVFRLSLLPIKTRFRSSRRSNSAKRLERRFLTCTATGCENYTPPLCPGRKPRSSGTVVLKQLESRLTPRSKPQPCWRKLLPSKRYSIPDLAPSLELQNSPTLLEA